IEAAVFLKRNIGVSTTEYSEEDHLTVTGIVGATTEGHRLLPRWPEDIVKGEVLAATTTVEEPKSPSTEVEVQTLTANSNSKALYSLLSVCVAAAGSGGFRFWQHRKKKSTHAGAENTDVV
ncbi:MAG: hypothetical protein Q8Q20_05095, partial [bacterium]|nr:hypothetical protein [bacterium]